MTPSKNVALIERFYAALDVDDVAAGLALCAPDVEWRYPVVDGLPYGGAWFGRAGVAAFLEAHDAAEEIVELRIDGIVADRDHVVAFGRYRGLAKPAARSWETGFVHVLTVRAGLISSLVAYFDTAAALAARRA